MNTAWHRYRYGLGLFAAVLVLLATWAVAVPLYGSPDEPAHIYKAYGTAHGEWLGDEQPGWSSNIRLFHVPAVMNPPDLRCWVGLPEVPAACANTPLGQPLSTAAVYPPPWYAAIGLPPRLLGVATSTRAYRMVAAALCAAAIAAAFVAARRSRARRFSPLLLIALTPMTLFLAGTVNPNAFEIVGFLLVWVLCLHHRSQRAPTVRGGLLFGGLIAVLVVSRFASVISLAAGLTVVAALIGRDGLRRFRNRGFIAAAAGCLVAAMGLLGAWSLVARVAADDPRTATTVGIGTVVSETVRRLPAITREMIGVLGWLDTMLPSAVYWAAGALAAIVLAGVFAARDRRLTIATALVAAGLVVVPVITNIATASRAGLIWQGRYSLALYALAGPIGMLAWQQASEAGRGAASTTIARAVRVGTCALFCIAELMAFWQALRRFTVGAHGKIWLVEPLPWRPSVAPLALVAVHLLATVALCTMVLAATRDQPGVVDPAI